MSQLLIFFLFSLTIFSQNALWLRYPAISPDGRSIAFSFKGDIYTVSSAGGRAIPITITEDYEFSPIWSHDGKQIAFSSNRYGNFDVFVMPSAGGEAKRLTFYSQDEIPSSFTVDNKSILFTTYKKNSAKNIEYPMRYSFQLYSVSALGGRVEQVLSTPALNARFSSTGERLIFHDWKGYEDDWRKRHRSAVTRDIWLYNFKLRKYTKLSHFEGEDRNPIFDSDDDHFFYLSEQNGSFNIFRSSISNPTKTDQLTNFKNNPIRFLSGASNGLLCFSYDGEIYTFRPGEAPKKVAIQIYEDRNNDQQSEFDISGQISDFKLSPNDKEYAYIVRGDIFVGSVEGGFSKRLTNTPWIERGIDFSPDGRTLIYASEKDNNWGIYSLSIHRKEERYFFNSTVLDEATVLNSEEEEYQPAYSPDGKEIAYFSDRIVLKVLNLADRKTRTILPVTRNFAYSDYGQYFTWSPDSKWLLMQVGQVNDKQRYDIALISSDGEKFYNLSQNGFHDLGPRWSNDGNMLIWGSSRNAKLEFFSYNYDVYLMFLNKKTKDKYELSMEEWNLKNEQNENKTDKDNDKKTVTIDFENLEDRFIQVTSRGGATRDWILSKDDEIVYFVERNGNLWSTDIRTKRTKKIVEVNAYNLDMTLSNDGKKIYILADRKLIAIDLNSGNKTNLGHPSKINVNTSAERKYIFDHAWRIMREKFYDTNLHGVNWDFYYDAYKKFLPYIANDYDFSEMLSEMMGELNASHAGVSYFPPKSGQSETAELGLYLSVNNKQNGLVVNEVLHGGPFDNATSNVKAGHILEKINDFDLSGKIDISQLLDKKTDKATLFTFFDPVEKVRYEEVVKPISFNSEYSLTKKRWIKKQEEFVKKLSDGRIGYVHISNMLGDGFRKAYAASLSGEKMQEAMIFDIRYNLGGNQHDRLVDLFNGKKYFERINDRVIGPDADEKWNKKSILLVNQGSYSDAHLLAEAYRAFKVGKTIGSPIPGTGTFVWYERQLNWYLSLGIIVMGFQTNDGVYTENKQFSPDILIYNDPNDLVNGVDNQLQKAVEELMKELK